MFISTWESHHFWWPSVCPGEVSLRIYLVVLLFHQHLLSAKAGDRHGAGWTFLTQLTLQTLCEVAQVLPTETCQLLQQQLRCLQILQVAFDFLSPLFQRNAQMSRPWMVLGKAGLSLSCWSWPSLCCWLAVHWSRNL